MTARREYFYTIDRTGRLFHDGTELTDAAFLNFFFKRVRANESGRHPQYPFVSPCAGELNFIRPADTPLVFKRLTHGGDEPALLSYAPDLAVPFAPRDLRFSENGVLYHRAPVGEFARIAAEPTLELTRQVETWGPYYSYLSAEGTSTVIEPLRPAAHLLVLHPRPTNECFGCGPANPVGLGLSFLFDSAANTARSWMNPGPALQGGLGRLHGGFIALLLDEVMAKVLTGLGQTGVCPTARLEVQFRRPIAIGAIIELRGSLLRNEGRKFFLKGEIRGLPNGSPAFDGTGADGPLLAEGEGLYVKVLDEAGSVPVKS